MLKEINKILKLCLLVLMLLPIACSSDVNGLGGLVEADPSCLKNPPKPPDGHFCDADNSLQAITAGYCSTKEDCPPYLDACSSKHQCIVSTSDKYWFATDFIRPAVTSD
ncbi:MAG: hypothetical protein JKY15_04605, partial [Deltaproteobacteria bacterium]|nr:hypothetical protein [Deltaproteobacteria bacterium]